MRIRATLDDRIFRTVSIILVWFVVIITLYPFLFVLSSSISDPKAVMQNKIVLFPVGFSFAAYMKVFAYPMLKTGYMNTIFYTVIGTVLNMLFTALMAYPLSRKSLIAHKYFMFIVTFTLLFSGGIIPTYLVVKEMGLIDTRWALIIPTLISTWNLILLKSFFENIPKELEEAATIDGCSQLQILFKIIIPLSVPAMATLSLFYAVTHWNAFFDAILYLSNQNLHPIQIFLRNIVIDSQTAEILEGSAKSVDDLILTESVKYATIMAVAMPIIVVYPFIQKHFVKGIMIGSLKG
ncbi:carbohydrate ABC transporter permease [Paenibacillus agricola]|uniref:Carbohydrate ABC transporter permease n=1 Tax=Paenibacillus agricola TaxID=2716264 RepID=A0ABX0J7Y0_9BACL|nr:carbohydrate ABC transporter permease [Paenibacillus agricola]NHN29865.1 carbohydrate ABC transporter permease [Paenibacillus agricola]